MPTGLGRRNRVGDVLHKDAALELQLRPAFPVHDGLANHLVLLIGRLDLLATQQNHGE